MVGHAQQDGLRSLTHSPPFTILTGQWHVHFGRKWRNPSRHALRSYHLTYPSGAMIPCATPTTMMLCAYGRTDRLAESWDISCGTFWKLSPRRCELPPSEVPMHSPCGLNQSGWYPLVRHCHWDGIWPMTHKEILANIIEQWHAWLAKKATSTLVQQRPRVASFSTGEKYISWFTMVDLVGLYMFGACLWTFFNTRTGKLPASQQITSSSLNCIERYHRSAWLRPNRSRSGVFSYPFLKANSNLLSIWPICCRFMANRHRVDFKQCTPL